MLKKILLLFVAAFASSSMYSQCTWPVVSNESFEYTTVIPDLIAGTTYQNTPQTYAGCVRTGSRGMYLNIVDGFQGLLYSRTYTVCVGQTYRFSFSTRDAFSSTNNLTFNVYSSANVLLSTQTVINGSTWNDITMPQFIAPTTTVRFEIVTNIPGSSGNDAGFDDLKLAACNTPNAGADNSASYCGPGAIIDLDNFLSSTAATGGTWTETTSPPSGMFNTSNAVWTTGDLSPGTYTFKYTVGPGTCTDFAVFTITLGNIAAVNLGADINLCAPATTTLNAGAGYQSYLWNNNTTAQTLNVTTSGTYHVRVGTLGSNVIVNGDFEAGNTGFTTQYTVGTGGTWGPVSNPGTYLVTTNPNSAHTNFTSCTDHTAAPGTKQMVVNGSSTAGTQVWCQNIPIQPATTYEFGCWVSTAVNDPAVAQLQFSINGSALGAVFSPPSTSCNWNQFTQNWFSGTTTNANICIVNQNTAASGNDFSLDDITFKPQCYSYDTVVVNIHAVPTVNAGPDQTVCAGTNVTLSATATPAAAVVTWNNGVTNGVSFPAPAATTTYTATATNGGICTATDQVTITVNSPVLPTFTPVGPFCSGATIAPLPTTSINGYSGLWTPAINNTATTTYTFTPTAGQCATTAQMTITINPQVTPTFTPVGPFCEGDAIAALPTTSINGYTGLWTPAINNMATTTYTFTPSANQCATTAQMTITINPPVTPTFTAVGPFCEGDAIADLPTTSNNGYSGLWTPAINNIATTTYTFTPSGSQCSTTAQMTITINPPVTPTFTAVGPFCEGDAIADLPTTSNNGYTGLWTPAINNMATTTYTFTPSGSQCATTAQMTISITAPTVPTFTTVGPFCAGDAIAPLPTTSNNSITGLWTPAINNMATTTYTFTPSGTQCATTAQMTTVINPPTTPTFDPIAPMCVGDAAPPLQVTSNEGDPGSWTPATISTAAAGSFTFTFHPSAGTCVTTAMITVTVGPPATPTFTPVGPFCTGDAIAPLPTTSNEGITGLWTPSINNTSTTTYTFNPTAGACATTAQMTIVINPPTTPSFTTVGPYCVNDVIPDLPTTSSNGYTGLWTPAINNTSTTVYTFTPDAGQCATTAQMTIVINPATVPTFTTPPPFCEGGTAPVLPATSNNSFTGTWLPSSVDNMTSASYTFTADPGQCASSATISITVNPNPVISVPDVTTCANTDVVLSASGGVSYSWMPGGATTSSITVNQPGPGPYTYTIEGTDANGCVGTTTANVNIAPGLSIAVNPASANICVGGSVSLTASGGTTYTWSPATDLSATSGATVTASPTVTTTYTVVGNSSGCTGQTTVVVTVGTQTTPTFDAIAAICSGSTAPILQNPSNENINGTWVPSVVNNTTSGTYTFTPATGQCATTASMNITVNAIPTVSSITETCDGTNTSYVVTVTISGGTAPFTLTENAPGGIGGSFSGSTWTSDPIPSGTAYDFDFYDATGCGPAKAAGSKNCNCSTDVGTMSPTLISLCGTAAASPAYNSAGEVQDANDTQSFILHTSAAGTAGTVIQSNSSGTFSFAAPMVYGTTYYISAVVGDNDGSGQVDLTDPCLALAPGTPVVWYQAPTATPTNNGPLCEGSTLNLTGNAVSGGTYQWTGPAPFTSTQQSPSILNVTTANAGVYTLVITANGCPSAPATTTVVINAPVLPTFNAIPAVCQGAAAPTLPNPSTNSPTIPGTWVPSFVNTSTAGTQTFIFTPNTGQCATSTTISVTVNPLPVPSAASVTTCPNSPISLCASGGTTYVWTPNTGLDNANIACPTATLTANQTYNITVGDPNGCQATTTASVTMAPGLTITVNPNTATICAGQSVMLTASGAGAGGNYSWTPIAGLDLPNSATVNASPGGTQTYTVNGSNNGCTGSTTVTVNVNQLPVMNAIPDITQCAGTPVSSVSFGTTPGGSSFTWNNTNINTGLSASGTSPSTPAFTAGNVSAITTGTVNVTPTLNGCVGAPETFMITINPNPVPTASSNSPVCSGTTLNLSCNLPGMSYGWTGPGWTDNVQNPVISPVETNQAGSYSVMVTDPNGCSATTSTTVVVNALPTPTINPLGPYCIDDNTGYPLGITPTPVSVVYSGPGVSGSTFTPSNTGAGGAITVNASATDANGCVGTTSAIITVNPLPPVTISAVPQSGCAPLIVTFTSDSGMSSSVWTFGDGSTGTDLGQGTITHTYSATGTYDVTVTNTLNGCSNTGTELQYITVEPDPVADFSVREMELSVVDPTVFITNSSTGAATYSWEFGDGIGTSTAVDPTYTYQSVPSTYTIDLIATSAAGCVDSTSLTIIVKDQLIFWVPNTFTPDGDAYNNTFQPVFTSGYDPYNFSMYIYNRWGEIIFESHDVTVGWDGTYNGELVQEGTFTWTMEIKDPQNDEVSRHEGHINVMR